MHFHRFVAIAMTAAFLAGIPALAGAAETYVIKPVFPDVFTLRMTSVQDEVKDQFGKVERSRTDLAILADMTRKGDGFQGVYRVDKFEVQVIGADGQVQSSPAATEAVSNLIKSAGVARVTLNGALEPVTVDNIEEIKAAVRSFMTDDGKSGDEGLVYTLGIMHLTPETAAQWVRGTNRSAVFYDVPLVLGQSVETVGIPQELIGTPVRNRTTLTLQDWEEGKVARLHSVSEPLQEDMGKFAERLIGLVVGSMPEPETEKNWADIARMHGSITFGMKETCDTEVDLSASGNYRSVCDADLLVTIDLARILDSEPLPEGVPPVITLSQKTHKVSENKILP